MLQGVFLGIWRLPQAQIFDTATLDFLGAVAVYLASLTIDVEDLAGVQIVNENSFTHGIEDGPETLLAFPQVPFGLFSVRNVENDPHQTGQFPIQARKGCFVKDDVASFARCCLYGGLIDLYTGPGKQFRIRFPVLVGKLLGGQIVNRFSHNFRPLQTKKGFEGLVAAQVESLHALEEDWIGNSVHKDLEKVQLLVQNVPDAPEFLFRPAQVGNPQPQGVQLLDQLLSGLVFIGHFL